MSKGSTQRPTDMQRYRDNKFWETRDDDSTDPATDAGTPTSGNAQRERVAEGKPEVQGSTYDLQGDGSSP